MKRLFDENDFYTQTASNLDKEVVDVLRPIVEKWAIEQDYSVRDMNYVVSSAVNAEILRAHFKQHIKRRKAEEEA